MMQSPENRDIFGKSEGLEGEIEAAFNAGREEGVGAVSEKMEQEKFLVGDKVWYLDVKKKIVPGWRIDGVSKDGKVLVTTSHGNDVKEVLLSDLRITEEYGSVNIGQGVDIVTPDGTVRSGGMVRDFSADGKYADVEMTDEDGVEKIDNVETQTLMPGSETIDPKVAAASGAEHPERFPFSIIEDSYIVKLGVIQNIGVAPKKHDTDPNIEIALVGEAQAPDAYSQDIAMGSLHHAELKKHFADGVMVKYPNLETGEIEKKWEVMYTFLNEVDSSEWVRITKAGGDWRDCVDVPLKNLVELQSK